MSVRIQPQPVTKQAYRDDRWDEVWEGSIVMSPMANNQHIGIGFKLCQAFAAVIDWNAGDIAFPGGNVSDRVQDWDKYNYRIPDALVVLANSLAVDHGTHWVGGPDLVVEITSPGEKPQLKLPFYAQVGTREVLIVHRDPWKLELFQLNTQQKLELAGESDITSSQVITSSVLPLSFQLIQGAARPIIVMQHTQTRQRWEA